MTTPSVVEGPPGNCAYPNSPPVSAHTQRFRCVLGLNGGIPPVDARFTSSLNENPDRVVWVRVTFTSLNCIPVSPISPLQGTGVLVLSGFVARKSLLSA